MLGGWGTPLANDLYYSHLIMMRVMEGAVLALSVMRSGEGHGESLYLQHQQ